MISFECPHCSNSINVGEDAAGRKGTCKKCGNAVLVPELSKPVIIETQSTPIIRPTARNRRTFNRNPIGFITALMLCGTALAVTIINYQRPPWFMNQINRLQPESKVPQTQKVVMAGAGSVVAPEESKWDGASNKTTVGDAVISITFGDVGKVKLKDNDIEVDSKEDFLKIGLQITNRSDVKKHNYSSWGKMYSSNRPLLSDEFGNYYNVRTSSFFADIVGQTEHASLYPGDSIKDMLVFEVPVEKATILKLELPGISLSNGEPMYFRFAKP